MSKPATNTRLQQALAESRNIFLIVALFSVVINLLMLTGPLYMLQVYDRVLTSASVETLVVLTLLAFGFILAQGLLEFVRGRILSRLTYRLDHGVSEPLLEAVLAHNLGRETASAGQALRDFDQFKSFIGGPGLVAFFDAPWTPIFLAAIFLIHPTLGVIALCGGLLLFLLTAASEFITRHRIAQANADAQAAARFADASLANAEAIAAMGMMPNVIRRWSRHHMATLSHGAKASERSGILTAAAKFVRQFLQIAMLGVAAWLTLRQEITPGLMIAASIILGRALAPVEAVIGQWRHFIAARGVYARLNDLLAEMSAQKADVKLPRPEGRLAVEHLVAAPPGQNKATIQNLSFALGAGETLGVIGPSGAGKSSLARLLVGAWRPVAGQVRLDGANIAKWPSEDRGPYIGYLPQGVELFEGTVAENIARIGAPDAEDVIAAAALAGAHDMILRLPEGYETNIGPAGRFLSAGQRQRVALARALYRDPALVVLDEPNANLDQQGEQALRGAIMALKAKRRTVVLIAHHTSMLGVCDKLLVLQNGRAEAFGPRDQVLSQLTRSADGGVAKPHNPNIRAVE